MQQRQPAEGRMEATTACCGAAKACLSFALVAVMLATGGCVVTRPDVTSPPPVQLVSTGELDLPGDCAATPGAMYRTLFEVRPDGRVTAPRSEPGNSDGRVTAPRSEPGNSDGCVQQALREWVATFTYAPLDATTPVAFDWMAVTASGR
jgi:hypothetical protein